MFLSSLFISLDETGSIERSGVQVIFLFRKSDNALAKSSPFGRPLLQEMLYVFHNDYFPHAGNRKVFDFLLIGFLKVISEKM